MAGSIVIYGGNKNTQKELLLKLVSDILNKPISRDTLYTNPDIKILEIPDDKKSIGIGETRGAIKYLSERPFQEKCKFLIINNANTLTREAQNSMLKTLEEPPSYAHIILLTKTLNDLLETVTSRCKKLNSGKNNTSKAISVSGQKNTYSKVTGMAYAQRLDWAGETYKEEKEVVLEILEEWVAEAREALILEPNSKDLENIKLINKIKEDIEGTNVNLRLALEALVLNLC